MLLVIQYIHSPLSPSEELAILNIHTSLPVARTALTAPHDTRDVQKPIKPFLSYHNRYTGAAAHAATASPGAISETEPTTTTSTGPSLRAMSSGIPTATANTTTTTGSRVPVRF